MSNEKITKVESLKNWAGLVVYTLSAMAIFISGLSWVIGMHIIPVNANIEFVKIEVSKVNTKLNKLIDNDIKHLKEDIEKIKTALKIK